MTPAPPLWKFPENSSVLVALLVPKYHQVRDIGSVTTSYGMFSKSSIFSQNQYQQNLNINILIWTNFSNFQKTY